MDAKREAMAKMNDVFADKNPKSVEPCNTDSEKSVVTNVVAFSKN